VRSPRNQQILPTICRVLPDRVIDEGDEDPYQQEDEACKKHAARLKISRAARFKTIGRIDYLLANAC
jgi:hypothetical protein